MTKAKAKETKNTYTYIGGGEDSPGMIKFMGIQDFLLGEATEVTNERVLKKIAGNPCFVKGAVDRKEIFENADKAKKKADKRRAEDRAITARLKANNKG